MLLEITDGSVSLGGRTILSHFGFEIHGSEKIALTGRNGAGKTTLLRVLAGELELDANEKNPLSGMKKARALKAGMLGQVYTGDPERTLEEQFGADLADLGEDSAERQAAEREADRLLAGFGFSAEARGRRLREFSGGEQRKLSLISLLLAKPDLLLLDEPTNHLDVETTEWLEEEIKAYPYAVVMVSHDRYFLEQTAQFVVEIVNGRTTRYAGNYSRFRKEKAASAERQRRAYERQQEEIRRLEALIERFRTKPRKAAFARSRKKILERMERIEKPVEDLAVIHTGEINPAHRGCRIPIETEKLAFGYGEPLKELTFRLRRGQKIGILGANGSGKTAFLRTLAGEIPKLSGKLSIGEGVEMGYFGQDSAEISGGETVEEWFREKYPLLKEQDVRHRLAGFLFRGRDLKKKISDLSGGEKARLVLAGVLEAAPNLLVLDEPTNHMDIPAKETLESIFRDYRGTMIFVSHDRYFTDRTADSLLIFGKAGDPVMYYPFGYSHYRERKNRGRFGENLSRQRTAEEQAMIEGLRSVPKRGHLPGELPVEEASWDWAMREALTEMEEAEASVRAARKEAEEAEWEAWEAGGIPGPSGEEAGKPGNDRLEQLVLRWTKACVAWYDVWQERAG